jgi:hypothetical protein
VFEFFHNLFSIWITSVRASGLGDSTQGREFLGKHFSDFNQIGDQFLFDLQMSLVFSKIAPLMPKRQNPPVFRRQAKGILQALKHQIAVVGTLPIPTQSRERQRMGRVVSEIEATFDVK